MYGLETKNPEETSVKDYVDFLSTASSNITEPLEKRELNLNAYNYFKTKGSLLLKEKKINKASFCFKQTGRFLEKLNSKSNAVKAFNIAKNIEEKARPKHKRYPALDLNSIEETIQKKLKEEPAVLDHTEFNEDIKNKLSKILKPRDRVIRTAAKAKKRRLKGRKDNFSNQKYVLEKNREERLRNEKEAENRRSEGKIHRRHNAVDMDIAAQDFNKIEVREVPSKPKKSNKLIRTLKGIKLSFPKLSFRKSKGLSSKTKEREGNSERGM